MKVQLVSEQDSEQRYEFICPGCGRRHNIPTAAAWQFNGNLDSPTFSPSLLSYYPVEGEQKKICHSFITDGNIQFLGDCYHNLAGTTVQLPDLQSSSDI